MIGGTGEVRGCVEMKRGDTHVGLVHWVAVLDTGQPVLGLVFGLHDASVDELEEGGLGVAVVLAQALEELVRLAEVEDIQGSPGLAGADVEPPLALREE